MADLFEMWVRGFKILLALLSWVLLLSTCSNILKWKEGKSYECPWEPIPENIVYMRFTYVLGSFFYELCLVNCNGLSSATYMYIVHPLFGFISVQIPFRGFAQIRVICLPTNFVVVVVVFVFVTVLPHHRVAKMTHPSLHGSPVCTTTRDFSLQTVR